MEKKIRKTTSIKQFGSRSSINVLSHLNRVQNVCKGCQQEEKYNRSFNPLHAGHMPGLDKQNFLSIKLLIFSYQSDLTFVLGALRNKKIIFFCFCHDFVLLTFNLVQNLFLKVFQLYHQGVKQFAGPTFCLHDLGPNCLQRLSADNKNHQQLQQAKKAYIQIFSVAKGLIII